MFKKYKFVIAAVLIAISIPFVASYFLSVGNTRNIIESYVESKTGRQLQIEGDLSVNWALSPTFSIEDVKWKNPTWAKDTYAITANMLRVSLSFFDLIKGRVTVTAISLEQPNLWVEQNLNTGLSNFELETVANGEAQEMLPDWIRIEDIKINDAAIVLRQPERDWHFAVDNASMRSLNPYLPSLIEVSGSIESTPVAFTGKVGSLEDLIHFRETAIELEGFLAKRQNKFIVSGVASDLVRWRGLNLWISARLDNLTDIQKIMDVDIPQIENISANWEIIQPGSVSSMRLEGLKLRSNDYGLETMVTGEIQALSKLNQIDLSFVSKGNLATEAISNKIDVDVNLDTVIQGRVSGDKSNLILQLTKADINAEGVSLHSAGQVALFTDSPVPLTVSFEAKNIHSIATIFGKNLDDIGLVDAGLKGSANLTFKDKSFHLDTIEMMSVDGNLLAASGSINKLGSNQLGQFDFKINLSKKDIPGHQLLIPINNLELTGELDLQGFQFSAPEVFLSATGQGITANAAGSVLDLKSLEKIQIPWRVYIDNLTRLSYLTEQTLPNTAAIELKGTVVFDIDNRLNIQDLNASSSGKDLKLNLSGEILDISNTPVVRLNVTGELHTIHPIIEINQSIPDIALWQKILPVNLQAELVSQQSETEQAWLVRDIRLKNSSNFKLVSSGQIQRIHNIEDDQLKSIMGDFKLSFNGEVNENDLNGLLNRQINPKATTGMWRGDMDIKIFNDRVELLNLNTSNNSEAVSLAIISPRIQFSPLHLDTFSIDFNTTTIDEIIFPDDFALQNDIPGRGNIKLNNTGNDLNIGLDLQFAENDIAGTIQISTEGSKETQKQPLSITANLKSDNFDLDQILAKSTSSNSFFSAEPISMQWLNDWSAQIEYQARKFNNRAFRVENFAATGNINNGKLIFQSTGENGRGNLKTDIEILTSRDKLDVKLNLDGKKVNLGAINKLYDANEPASGLFNIDIDISGSGNSISEIASSAYGQAIFEVTGAKVKNNGLELIGGDLLMGLFLAVNPLQQQDEYLNLECGVVSLNIENGQGSTPHGIAFKTDVVTLLGGGSIDFSDESLQFVVRPKARKGLGINTSSIAKVVRIGGTLKSPDVETDPKGLLQSGVAIGAAIASGGLSLLAQGLYDRTRANADVCQLALNSRTEIDVRESSLSN